MKTDVNELNNILGMSRKEKQRERAKLRYHEVLKNDPEYKEKQRLRAKKHYQTKGKEKLAQMKAERHKKIEGRKCNYRNCGKDLVGIHPNRKYCNLTCRNRELRKRNPDVDKAAAKARVDKWLRDGRMLPPDTENVTYYNYKEPLREFLNDDGKPGFGYRGTLMGNQEKTHVQCHICGYFFAYLPGHLSVHNMNAKEYKLKVGLSSKTALVSETRRNEMIEAYRKLPPEHHARVKNNFSKYNKDKAEGKVSAPKKENSPWNLERRNKEGLCPDQLLDKIVQLGKEIGRSPSSTEFRRYYKQRYSTAIIAMFGSWNNAVKLSGFTPKMSGSQIRYTDEQLLEYMRNFYEVNKRVPTNSDMRRGILPSHSIYIKRFGTFNNARFAAGIPILIPLAGRRFVEVSIEDAEKFGYKTT